MVAFLERKDIGMGSTIFPEMFSTISMSLKPFLKGSILTDTKENIMKMLLVILLAISTGSLAAAETVRVDATKNCLGLDDAETMHVSVKKGVTYELTIKNGKAIFNKSDKAQMANVGVMYVEPKRKMKIDSVSYGEKTYVITEGNLYFFFVDDKGPNKGGLEVEIKEVNK